jgi:hypothetical protein
MVDLLHHFHLLQLLRNSLVVFEGLVVELLPQLLLNLVGEDACLRFYGLLLPAGPHPHDLLPNYVADLLSPAVLVHHSHLELELLLCLEILVDLELKVEVFIDRLHSQIKTHPVLFLNLQVKLQLLWNFDPDAGVTDLDCQFIIKAELLGAFAEAGGHFEVEEVDGFKSDHFLLVELFEFDAVGHSTCPLDDLVDDVVADSAVVETDNVHHAVRLHCVLGRQLRVEQLRLLQLRGLLSLPEAHVRQSVSDDHAKYLKAYIWCRSCFHACASPRQKTNAGVMAVCPSASALVMLAMSLSPTSWMEEREISDAACLPASSMSSMVFSEILPTTLQSAKPLTGYSMLELK